MVLQSASNAALKAAAIRRFLNSNSTRKRTREPRSPMASKCHSPVRLRNGPSTRCMRISESFTSVLRVVNDADRCEPPPIRLIRDSAAGTPGKEFGIATDVIDQREHLGGRVRDDGAAFDDLQTLLPRRNAPQGGILAQHAKRGRRQIGRLAVP